MNQWPGTYREPWLPPVGRGRVGTRLVRGLLWALLLTFMISVLLFIALTVFRAAPPNYIF